VLDGMSDDGTREIVARYADRHTAIRMVDNPHRIVSTGLNLGIAESSGAVILRMDAHAEYPPHYVSRLLQVLVDEHADNTGGVCDTRPGSSTLMAKALAAAMSSPFGVGASYFRVGSNRIREVDTVPFGCYRREVFHRIGTFDEELARNQDDELNARLRKHGGKILLVPDVVIGYYARANLRQVMSMFYQYGLFKPLVVKKVGGPATIRQFMPVAFVLVIFILTLGAAVWSPLLIGLCAVVAFHLLFGVAFGLQQSARWRDYRLPFVLPLVFWVIHWSYGLGYLHGILRFIALGRRPEASAFQISR
jgi:glycosyltransferase involved in cell wall biosynthesis